MAFVDSLTAFTTEVLKYSAAETRYHEYLGRAGASVSVSEGGTCRGIRSSDGVFDQKPKSKPTPVPVVAVVRNAGSGSTTTDSPISGLSALSQQIALAREQITSTLLRSSSSSGGVAPSEDDAMIREENLRLKQKLEQLESQVTKLTDRVARLEGRLSNGAPESGKKPIAPTPKDDEDDVDLFGSDEEDDEAAKLKEQRLAEYAAKKSKKPQLIAKSNVILDVKPWDDETDMKELEKCVRSVVMDGLLWGVSKLMPVGYGIQKLQITTVIEDDKVSVDDLIEKLQEFEDFIQSVDIAAFNKI